ncbi:MAG: DUF4097 family beta strand repeat-containing protein [Acidobacteriota bacterium]
MIPLHKTHRFAAAATLVALLATPAFAAERTINQSYTLGDQGRLSLDNVNGDVEIEGWDKDEVELVANIRSGDRDMLKEVEIDVDINGDRIHIETDYPDSKGGWGRDWAEVDYQLKVPRGTELAEISLVNGSLRLEAVAGDVEASLVNGSLNARGLSGSVELSSVNGGVDLALDRLGDGQRIDVESVNGSIRVRLPADADAEVTAETVHGSIKNDFGLKVIKGEYVGSDMRGRLGSGSARMSLENVNGSIRVER